MKIIRVPIMNAHLSDWIDDLMAHCGAAYDSQIEDPKPEDICGQLVVGELLPGQVILTAGTLCPYVNPEGTYEILVQIAQGGEHTIGVLNASSNALAAFFKDGKVLSDLQQMQDRMLAKAGENPNLLHKFHPITRLQVKMGLASNMN